MDLSTLQSEVKKDPSLYQQPVFQLIKEYQQLASKFPQEPSAKHIRLGQLISFLSQICMFFQTELRTFCSQLLNIFDNYASALNPQFRQTILQGLIIMCNRGQIPAKKVFLACLKLFRVEDKNLRKQVFKFLSNNMKKLQTKNQIKDLQQEIYNMVKEVNLTAAKKALHLLMTLYVKKVWNDKRTVNKIASACKLKEPKLVRVGCIFLLEIDTHTWEGSDDQQEMQRPRKKIIGAKKNKGKIHKIQRKIKSFQRHERKSDKNSAPTYLAIDLLNNPDQFVQKTFKNMKNNFSRGHFETRLVMMQLLGRIIGRNKLAHYEFYSFLQRHLVPKGNNITQLLITSAQSMHQQVPPQQISSLINRIVNNFISDNCKQETLVLGLNTMREICRRQPLAISKELLTHLSKFKEYKNKPVQMAAASLINVYREVKPSMIQKKQRIAGEDMFDDYGNLTVHFRVPGFKYLGQEEYQPKYNQTVYLAQPFVKSQNLIKLEALLKEKGIVPQRKLEEDRKEEESLEGEFEQEEEQRIQTGIPVEYDRILTNKDFQRIRQKEIQAKAKILHRKYKPEEILSDQEEDTHIFIDEEDVATMPMNKHQKREASQALKKEKRAKKQKKGGKTHKQHAKSKPYTMVIKKRKKVSLQTQLASVNRNIKKTKQQLGKIKKRFGKNQKQINK